MNKQFGHIKQNRSFVQSQFAQTLEANPFHTKSRQHTSIDHRLTYYMEGHAFLHVRRQVTSETAGKSVPCPGWIMNIFQRISPGAEEFVFAKEQRTMFAFLDRNIARTVSANFSSGPNQARFFCHLARLAVVQNQQINPPQ